MSKPLLGLVMIVKDSGEIIDKVLKSVEGVIDYWCILDTGSKDGTPERIKKSLRHIPGEIYTEPFVDFSTTRNRSLDLLGCKTEWAVILDDSYELRNGDVLRNFLRSCKQDAVTLPIHTENDEKVYNSLRVVRTDKLLRYKYRVHEAIFSDTFVFPPENVHIFDWKPSDHLSRSRKRYSRDYELLLLDHKENPKDSRITMYLAKTCKILGRKEESEKWLFKTAELDSVGGDNKYEVNLGILDILRENHGITSDKYIEFVKKHAYEYRDYPDAQFELARCFYLRGMYPDSYGILKKVIKMEKVKNTCLIQDVKVQRVNAPALFLDCCFRLGHIQEGIDKLKEYLKEYPDEQVFKSIRNSVMKPPYEPIAKFGKNLLVLVTVSPGGEWDIDNPVSRMEEMVVNMALQFVERDWRVFIFSNFREVKDFEGIDCCELRKFDDWVRTHWVDVLVSVRHPEYLSYYDNVSKVYLWADDLPSSDLFHTHMTKFKGIITSGKWHADHISQWYSLPPNMFIHSRSAIYTDRFLTLDEKRKRNFSFVHFSSPEKGLDRVVEVFQKILEKLPKATLSVFCPPELIDDTTLSLIRKNRAIKLMSRLPKEDFDEKLKEYDGWIYLNEQEESHSLQAIECMAAGVLCVTMNKGCLKELIADKGVVTESSDWSDKTIEELIKKLCFVMERPFLMRALKEKARKWALEQTYSNICEEWIRYF